MKKHPIGERIKSFRLKRCWTQAKAAAVLGVGLRTLVSLETGKLRGEPRPLTLAKICMAMESLEKAA